jgi:hypothetical protein
MTLIGHVFDGKIVLEVQTPLPEGAVVRVEVVPPQESAEKGQESAPAPRTLLERFGNVFGAAVGLPEDAARNHDHYLYGTPKLP